jgi:hypothetical protein
VREFRLAKKPTFFGDEIEEGPVGAVLKYKVEKLVVLKRLKTGR